MYKNQKVVVVLPAYNAAKTLELTYNEIDFNIHFNRGCLIRQPFYLHTCEKAPPIRKRFAQLFFRIFLNYHVDGIQALKALGCF